MTRISVDRCAAAACIAIRSSRSRAAAMSLHVLAHALQVRILHDIVHPGDRQPLARPSPRRPAARRSMSRIRSCSTHHVPRVTWCMQS